MEQALEAHSHSFSTEVLWSIWPVPTTPMGSLNRWVVGVLHKGRHQRSSWNSSAVFSWAPATESRSSDGQQAVDVLGVSPFLREKQARFLVEVEKAAGSFKVLQSEDTDLEGGPSPHYRDSLLFIEAHLRRSVPTDGALVVGHRAAMDALP